MKIAIFSPLATVAPHFETELEIIQRHIDAGDQVDVLACDGGLACCDFNSSRSADRCDSCIGRRRAGLNLLDQRVALFPIVDGNKFDEIPAEIFVSLDALKAYRLDHFDIGYAILSSLVSICRDPQPDLAEHRELVKRLGRAALATYRKTLEYCRREAPDRVYVFNGRFAATRAVLRACEVLGIDCWIHERGCDVNHFQLFVNKLPHDIDYMQQRIRDAWKAAATDPSREITAASWFTDRVNRVERNWHSFVKHQAHGRLPKEWSNAARNVTIFTSSEDEFVSIGQSWQNSIYPNQVEALRRIISDLEPLDDRIHLYVRVHPNLKKVANEYLRGMLALSGPRVTVIPPADPVDSYALLQQSEKVVTFGSSVGIEAVFWDRPSIVLGPCFYRGFPGVHQPSTHDDAMQQIAAELTPATDKSGALMYGYWFQTHGQRFKYFEATGLFEGRFRGQLVYGRRRKPAWVRIAVKVKRWMSKRAKAKSSGRTLRAN